MYDESLFAERCIRAHVRGQVPSTTPCEAKLTDREMEVYLMIGQGLSTKRIADELCLSPKTIDSHREHIKEKLGVNAVCKNGVLKIQIAKKAGQKKLSKAITVQS